MTRHLLVILRFVTVVLVFVAVAGSEPAYAFTQDWGGLEDDWAMPTKTGGSTPTTLTCVAYVKNNQACRECAIIMRPDGTETKPTCVGVAWAASCYCINSGTASCAGRGVCDYK